VDDSDQGVCTVEQYCLVGVVDGVLSGWTMEVRSRVVRVNLTRCRRWVVLSYVEWIQREYFLAEREATGLASPSFSFEFHCYFVRGCIVVVKTVRLLI
jgi:hypothetical protein